MEGHPEIKAINSRIEQYASLLRIRKKSALWGIVAGGGFSVVSLAAAIGLMWAFRDRTTTYATMFIMSIFLVYPPLQLMIQGAEYRRLNGVLELLDVLQRATSESAPEDRDS
jgi:hypothetical protein